MPQIIATRFAFATSEPTEVLLQFEAAPDAPGQRLVSAEAWFDPPLAHRRVPADDGIGERIWLTLHGALEVQYRAKIQVDRAVPDLESLVSPAPRDLPAEVVHYLFDSRYCPADRYQAFVAEEFGATTGGARILAIRDWIVRHFTYQAGSSTTETTGEDSLNARRGVCRDYAHVLVMLARASMIPARYTSCFAPGVRPQDFHAVAEVFLADPADPRSGAWHMVDATGMADPAQTVLIGVGRDAADVSFITSFGPSEFRSSHVEVRES